MSKLRLFYRYVKEKYRLLIFRKYTTLAGTLVFFLIMSIVPLSFWISLLVGRLPIDTDKILGLSVFDTVKDVLLYVQEEALNATAGASVILIFTTLYSSTNLFYQIRRSGEIIYDFQKKEKGLRLRLGALALLIIVMASVVVILFAFAIGSFLFSQFSSRLWEKIADYALLAFVSFFLCFLLNMYICPYKTKPIRFLKGTVVTVLAWGITGLGFSVYLKISNMRRLYGALSTIIVFLLWLYVLMICFIVGVILNSEKILAERKKGIKSRKKTNAK
ncbi:MAG: YihY/virulence factor BrkB family protein [Clostridia bacterium]|nr:YihY/virulence factor BrkB family protein [Clostridia bacterium]